MQMRTLQYLVFYHPFLKHLKPLSLLPTLGYSSPAVPRHRFTHNEELSSISTLLSIRRYAPSKCSLHEKLKANRAIHTLQCRILYSSTEISFYQDCFVRTHEQPQLHAKNLHFSTSVTHSCSHLQKKKNMNTLNNASVPLLRVPEEHLQWHKVF